MKKGNALAIQPHVGVVTLRTQRIWLEILNRFAVIQDDISLTMGTTGASFMTISVHFTPQFGRLFRVVVALMAFFARAVASALL